MAYTPTTWVTGDKITANALNKIENGIANGGGYDLVIVYDYTVNPVTCVVAEGDILDCEDKLDSGETINGICVVKGCWSFTPSGANSPYENSYLPLIFFSAPYNYIGFGGIWYAGNTIMAKAVRVSYDPSTGAITQFADGGKGL